jgi:hypothetical protein
MERHKSTALKRFSWTRPLICPHRKTGALSQLVIEQRWIKEIDINLLVSPNKSSRWMRVVHDLQTRESIYDPNQASDRLRDHAKNRRR